MFDALDTAVAIGLSQMDLYCRIGEMHSNRKAQRWLLCDT